MASLSRNVCRGASRLAARRSPIAFTAAARPVAAKTSSLLGSALPASSRASFSAMSALRAERPASAYDPEIADVANYVHNYNIDSDLAVRLEYHPRTHAREPRVRPRDTDTPASMTLLATSCSTPSAAVSAPSSSLNVPRSSAPRSPAPRSPMACVCRAPTMSWTRSTAPSTSAP